MNFCALTLMLSYITILYQLLMVHLMPRWHKIHRSSAGSFEPITGVDEVILVVLVLFGFIQKMLKRTEQHWTCPGHVHRTCYDPSHVYACLGGGH